jgi:hypothetical protein
VSTYLTGRNHLTFSGVERRLTATQIARRLARQQCLRQEAVDAVLASKRKRERGEPFDTLDTIGKAFKVTRQTLHEWVRASDAAGGTPPPGRPGRPPRWAGEGATIGGDLHCHLLGVPPEQRTTEALIDWFAARTGVQYAAASLPRMLWRLKCHFAASEGTDGAWSGNPTLAVFAAPTSAPTPAALPTSVPDWLTDGRRRRILELVDRAVEPRYGLPVTADTVMEQMPTMTMEMQNLGVTLADFCSILSLIGVKTDPISGRLRIA